MAAAIVVVDCVIEEIRTPDTPATVVYNLMAAAHFEDLSPAFYQYPPCDYTLTETIAWDLPTIDADPDAIEAVSDYRISVSSAVLDIHGVYTLTLTDTVTYNDQSWAPSVAFDVDIRDPCKTSTIEAITLTDMTVTLGESVTQNFAEAVDTAETTYGLDSCGARVYSIVLRSDGVTEVDYARIETIVENSNYRIVSDYSDESYEGTHELALYVTMLNYPVADDGTNHPTLLSNFDLTISAATCDCKLLNWIYPEAQSLTTTVLKATPDSITILHATVDEESKDDTPAIRACYRTDLGAAPGCDETTVITSVVIESTGILPGYMTLSGDDLTVAPTANGVADSYTMLVTHSTTFEDDDIEFNTLTIVVDVCVITHIDIPTDPSPVEYTIHALADTTVDLSSPGFVQQPACGYSLTEVMAWSFNPSPANPITTDNANPYTLLISSAVNSDADVYSATLTNSVSYQGQSFLPAISFDITVIDPCLTTVIDALTITDITQETGVTVETVFDEPDDSAGSAVGD